ncbi:hypothetical protein [Paenibacillus alginolyticus]|uniref:hypothetical protein n=1 Tax=Paenibacillus alginolyticus TaxID=59839 RepID=UPI002DBB5636|nr:hypothetical protein [Paenibacillus alginolyticus]MEC0146700.1 hypothetical protein [Paenibacillus alginolyticus]
MTKYKIAELSKVVGFHRKHQRVPSMEQVEKAYKGAMDGDLDSALRLLDWKRHCFYVKDEYQREVMAKVFEFCSEIT